MIGEFTAGVDQLLPLHTLCFVFPQSTPPQCRPVTSRMNVPLNTVTLSVLLMVCVVSWGCSAPGWCCVAWKAGVPPGPPHLPPPSLAPPPSHPPLLPLSPAPHSLVFIHYWSTSAQVGGALVPWTSAEVPVVGAFSCGTRGLPLLFVCPRCPPTWTPPPWPPCPRKIWS